MPFNSSIVPCLSFTSCQNSVFLSLLTHSMYVLYMGGVECWKSSRFSCHPFLYLNIYFHSALIPLSNHILFNQLSCDLPVISCDLPVLSYLVWLSLSWLHGVDLLSIMYEWLLFNALQFLYHSLPFIHFLSKFIFPLTHSPHYIHGMLERCSAENLPIFLVSFYSISIHISIVLSILFPIISYLFFYLINCTYPSIMVLIHAMHPASQCVCLSKKVDVFLMCEYPSHDTIV